jgi:hypothetical protein
MAKRDNYVFLGLQIVAWIIFVALCIEAGALLVNFIYSLFRPEVVNNLYQKLDLSQIYNVNRWVYFGLYSFILFIALLKAYLFYIVIKLLSKLDLAKPFNSFVSGHITTISYITVSIGIISYVAREVTRGLAHHGFDISPLTPFWADSRAYILMAAVLYVIATIFARGVELQNENDLTV